MKINRAIGIALLTTTLAACSSTPEVSVTRAPDLPHQSVIKDKPVPPQVAEIPETVGSCSVGNQRVGRPYTIRGVRYVPKHEPNYKEIGIASFYGKQHHGNQTANGERFNMNALSAAHTTLPLPSCVKVTNLNNNKSIVLRVNDRGPFIKGRIIDVSFAAAQELGFVGAGLTEVRVEVVN